MSQQHLLHGTTDLSLSGSLKTEEELSGTVNNSHMGNTHILYPPSNLPISILAPISENDYNQQPSPTNENISLQTTEQKKTLSEDSSVEIDGIHYNNRGYEICGQLNQHSKPCQRIGSCPFHKKLNENTENTETIEGTDSKANIKKLHKKDPPIKRGPYKKGWTKEEHILFLNGLQIHGKGAWKEISMIVRTRTPTQIQSHAQKYFLRQKQQVKNKRSIHDISLDDLTSDVQPEPVRSLNSKHSPQMNRGQNYGYPVLTQFTDHLNMTVLNPLHPMVSPPGLAQFQLPYGSSNAWLPQIYPFAMPLTLTNIHDDRNMGIDMNEERPNLNENQPLSLKPISNQDDFPKLGEKRAYDAFSFHAYAADRKSVV